MESQKVTKLKPERLELALEACQLSEFGYTQQQIADALKIPRRSISYWLNIFANNTNGGVAKYAPLGKLPIANNGKDIILYPTTYETAAAQILPESIDLIVTDPPYLVSSDNLPRHDRIDLQRDFGVWDKTPQAEYEVSVKTWAELMAKHLKIGGSLYLFMALQQYELWKCAFENNGLTSLGELIWHRTNPAPQIRQTRWCHAFNTILFFSKGAPKTFNWLNQNGMHNVIDGPICGGNERKNHPTQKPRYLLEKLIFVSSRVGNTILDPFAGSGSTGFAALRLLRKATLVEPEPLYSALIQHTAKNDFNIKVKVNGQLH